MKTDAVHKSPYPEPYKSSPRTLKLLRSILTLSSLWHFTTQLPCWMSTPCRLSETDLKTSPKVFHWLVEGTCTLTDGRTHTRTWLRSLFLLRRYRSVLSILTLRQCQLGERGWRLGLDLFRLQCPRKEPKASSVYTDGARKPRAVVYCTHYRDKSNACARKRIHKPLQQNDCPRSSNLSIYSDRILSKGEEFNCGICH